MNTPRPVSRRDAMRWILGAAATIGALDFTAAGATGVPPGIGMDPDLHKKIIPWPRLLTDAELRTVTALCDTIIPADDTSPAASAVGVPDFIDEWVSAPYAQQVGDRDAIRPGLTWIEKESQTRFQKPFPDLTPGEREKICDDICSVSKAAPAYKGPAAFFSKMRTLTAGGYYTTPEGWKAIGYIGNTPLAEFPGPPPEVLKHLGLA